MLEVTLLTIYLLFLVCILAYCIAISYLAYQYVQHKKKKPAAIQALAPDLALELYPYVTVQLPIFNELYVVERLIDTVAAFDYPKKRLQIQVLDDSTDETVEISQAKVDEYLAKGFDITLYHRTDRTGYKAGALQAALSDAKGEFVAIFDADFMPNPDFLKKTIPYFSNPKIGVVQTRWEHINKGYSLLTQIQAFFLDVHFSVEQLGRNVSGFFMNFNGTAGVWRKATIADAGGWQADTLTEDLDLSYRAQLKGWQFKYLEDVGSPSELPADMPSFKSQQFRWIKGGAETAKKLIPDITKAVLPLNIKFNAFIHLLSSSVYIIIFLMAVLSVPLLIVKNQTLDIAYEKYGAIFFLSNLAVAYVYFTATRFRGTSFKQSLKTFAYLLPIFLAMTLGLSLHNAVAAIRGYLGEKTPFVRTPKFNIKSVQDIWKNKKYVSRKIDVMTILEGLMALYFLAAIMYGFYFSAWELLPFHFLAFFGFSSVFLYSVRHTG